MFQYWNIVDTVDTADIVHTVDTLDIVKSVNSVDNVSSVNSVHNVHNARNDFGIIFRPNVPKLREGCFKMSASEFCAGSAGSTTSHY